MTGEGEGTCKPMERPGERQGPSFCPGHSVCILGPQWLEHWESPGLPVAEDIQPIPRAQIPRGALNVGWAAPTPPCCQGAFHSLRQLHAPLPCLDECLSSSLFTLALQWISLQIPACILASHKVTTPRRCPSAASLSMAFLRKCFALCGPSQDFCEWANNWISLPVCTWAHFPSSLGVSLRVCEIWPCHGLPERGRKTFSQTSWCLLLSTAWPWHKASTPCQTHHQQLLPADISSSLCPQCLLLQCLLKLCAPALSPPLD